MRHPIPLRVRIFTLLRNWFLLLTCFVWLPIVFFVYNVGALIMKNEKARACYLRGELYVLDLI